MTKAQKAALRFAYDALRGHLKLSKGTSLGQLGVHQIVQLEGVDQPQGEMQPGIWLEPDCDPERAYLNEAIFAALVMRGYMEVRWFHPNKLWLYRITPQGCTAIGKVYPGTPPTPQPPLKKFSKKDDPHSKPTPKPDHRDPHRFRRSNDWRKG